MLHTLLQVFSKCKDCNGWERCFKEAYLTRSVSERKRSEMHCNLSLNFVHVLIPIQLCVYSNNEVLSFAFEKIWMTISGHFHGFGSFIFLQWLLVSYSFSVFRVQDLFWCWWLLYLTCVLIVSGSFCSRSLIVSPALFSPVLTGVCSSSFYCDISEIINKEEG